MLLGCIIFMENKCRFIKIHVHVSLCFVKILHKIKGLTNNLVYME